MTAHPQQILDKMIEVAEDPTTSHAVLVFGLKELPHDDLAQALALAVQRLAAARAVGTALQGRAAAR